MQADRRARWVMPLAIAALLIWPLSYTWTRAAEIGAMLLAVVAITLGTMAAREDGSTPWSERGTRLGLVVVFLVIGGNLLGQALSG